MLTDRALWIIERNLDEPLTLTALATACAVSPFHLARAFAAHTGTPVMRYVRSRRLHRAATRLAAHHAANRASGQPPGKPLDILDLALDAGYASHEAFTRAFRANFGTTPTALRDRASLDTIAMTQPPPPSKPAPITLPAAPRIEAAAASLVLGLQARHSVETAVHTIPAHWREFMARIADIPHQTGAIPVSAAMEIDEHGNFDYLAGTEVSRIDTIPPGLTRLDLPARTYAVFTHTGHISTIGATYDAIWNSALAAHRLTPERGPTLERMRPSFDRTTGLGGAEIWVPIAPPR